MVRIMEAAGAALAIPVWTDPQGAGSYHLEIRDAGEHLLYTWELPARPPEKEAASPDYYARLPLIDGAGRQVRGALRIACDAPFPLPDMIAQQQEAACDAPEDGLHYHAPYGWLNDPNGMVFHNGLWHLYHQHNPMNSAWGNMTWGHAVSRDLVHFTFLGDVLFPEEDAVIFSGCGLVNERGCFGLPREALLFFYTLARERALPDGTKEPCFVQKMAWSADGGGTLIQYPGWELPMIAGENRDPKIFWHSASNAYIMALYLTGNLFRILRSADLERWETVCELDLPPMWECPDLIRLSDALWAFMSADGYYYTGRFDGFRWQSEGKLRKLYANDLPYAAQSFSGAGGRNISIAWLRTKNRGENWTGMMSLPRELSLGRDADGAFIRQAFVREAAPYLTMRDGRAVIEDDRVRETLDAEGKELLAEQLF